MCVRVMFECNGCDAKAEGTAPLRKRFTSFSGRDYGFGSARWENTPDNVAPDGWIAADPYTYVTYCPKCWSEIEASDGPIPAAKPTEPAPSMLFDPDRIAAEVSARLEKERT